MFSEVKAVTQIYCPECQEFCPVIQEPMHKTELYEYLWGDLVCGHCHFVIATLRIVPETVANA